MTMVSASFILGFVAGEIVGIISTFIIVLKERKSKIDNYESKS